MPTPTLTSITGNSLPEIVNNLEKQRKELEHLLSFLDSENIKEVPAETVSGQIGTNQLADFAVTRLKVADAAIGSAQIEELSVNSGHIQDLSVETAHIQDLAVVSAKIALLAVGTAHIQDLAVDSAKLAHASVDTIHIKEGVVGELQIADASITDAKIVDLSATKLTAGTIDTGTVDVSGPGGNLRITGNRVQVFDKQDIPIERVSMGDVNGDGTVYGFLMRGADGTTVLMDINGVKEAGITDGAITNPKIGQGAVKNNNIFADTITGDRLVVNSITGRELAVKAIKANSGIIDDLAIGTAHIMDGAITNAKIGNAEITSAKIQSLDVEKLNAGSIVVGTDNLAFNSVLGKDIEGWSLSTGVTRDPSKTYKGAVSFKAVATGLTSPGYRGAKIWNTPYRIPCVVGEEFTASVHTLVDNKSTLDDSVFVELEFYDAGGVRIKTAGSEITPLLVNGKWARQSVTSTAPTNATHAGMYFWIRTNGTVWFAAPQLQRGKFLTEYSPSGTYISSSGIMTSNITFSGNLSGATGTFSGTLTGSIIDVVNPSAGHTFMTFKQGTEVRKVQFGGNGRDAYLRQVENPTYGTWNLENFYINVDWSRFYGNALFYDSYNGELKVSIEATTGTMFAKVMEGHYGTVFESRDTWLRINEKNPHPNGVYFANSVVRTDGRLEVGNGGATFKVDGSYILYKGREVLTGTNGSGRASMTHSTRIRTRVTHNFGKSHTPIAVANWRQGDVGMDNVAACYIENADVNGFDFVAVGTGFTSGQGLNFYWTLVEQK